MLRGSLIRAFPGFSRPITSRGLSTFINAAGAALARRRAIEIVRAEVTDPRLYGELGLPFRGQPTAEDLGALDRGTYLDVAARLLGTSPTARVLTNDPMAEARPHFYSYSGPMRTLSPRGLRTAMDLGMNRIRAQFSMFPNGGREVPPEAWSALVGSWTAQQRGRAAASEIAPDDPFLDYRRGLWERAAPVESVIKLGRYSFVQMGGHVSYTDGEFIVDGIVARTTSRHLFDGTAVWIRATNTRTGATRFAVIGAGDGPVRVLESLNVNMAGPLFDAIDESTVEFIERYPELAEAIPDLALRTSEPGVRARIIERLSADSLTDRCFLELADSASGLAVAAKSYVYTTTPEPPTSDQLDAAEGIIAEAPNAPSTPLLSDDEQADVLTEQARDAGVQPQIPPERPVEESTDDVLDELIQERAASEPQPPRRPPADPVDDGQGESSGDDQTDREEPGPEEGPVE